MSKFRTFAFVLALILAALAPRAPFLGRKIFNTDEGATFMFAQQILAGDVMYRDSADIRLPLLQYLKAGLFAVAGDWNIPPVRVVFALALGLGAVGMWRIGRRLGDDVAGRAAALAFTVIAFAMLEGMEGFALHVEWLVVLCSIAGFVLLARALTRPTLAGGAYAGACFGLATLAKQPGVLDFGVALVLVTLLIASRRHERGALLRCGAGMLLGYAAVLFATAMYFVANDAWRDLHYYTWTFNRSKYTQEQAVASRLGTMIVPLRLMWHQLPALLALGVVGAAGLLWRAGRQALRDRTQRLDALPWLILGWSASGLVASTLSGRGFSHYSIQCIPGFSLACGWGAARLLDWARAGRTARALAVGAGFAAIAAVTSWQLVRRWPDFTPKDDFTSFHGEMVHAFTRSDERILVWGFFPEFYTHVERLPATKFFCVNFLTGLIPWTNLDPLIDTSYAVIPNADAEFAAELRRQPPALLVEIGHMRGMLKYPLLAQPVLGPELIAHYARVRCDRAGESDFHYYRRCLPAAGAPAPAPAGLPLATDAVLTTRLPAEEVSVPRLHVSAPAGVTRVDLIRHDQVIRSLAYPATEPCDVEFLLTAAEAAGEFRVVLERGADRREVSTPIDLGAALAAERARPVAGPVLRFAGLEQPPLQAVALEGAMRWLPAKERWFAHAPSMLRYRRPAAMATLELGYGLDEEAYLKTDRHGSSNGVDLVVEFAPDSGGPTQRLLARRLKPTFVATDRGPQKTTLTLPPNVAGLLTLRLQPGENFDSGFDWSYWTEVSGSTPLPVLNFEREQFAAIEATAADKPGVQNLGDDQWFTHPPARLVFPFPSGARWLEFDYGIVPKTYDGSFERKTDGVRFRVVAEHADGASEELFVRFLEPATREADRGDQHARVPLPERGATRLVFLTDFGPRQDPAYDWGWTGRLRATR